MSNTKAATVKKSKNDQETAGSSSTPPAKGSCSTCCRRILAFLASTLGLTILAVAYSALGGYIFMVLESPAASGLIPIETATETGTVKETRMRSKLLLDREAVRVSMVQHLELLWNMTEHMNVLYGESWTEMAEKLLQKYTEDVFEAVWLNDTAHPGFEGATEGPGETPGQVDEDQWSYPGSLLYAITVVTTIGYGHITPKTQWGMIVTMVYAVFGIPLTILTIAHLGRIMATAFRFLYRNVCCFACRVSRRRRNAAQRPNGQLNTREATPCVENGETGQATEVMYEEPDDRKRIADVKVPISVTVVVLVGYIALGSILFSIWEGWNLVEASYFCFITLSTIGFGDFVPGSSLDTERSHEKLLCCALYLLLGLSFLAMCFDLIQEEVVNKFQRLGRCIGLIKDSK